MRKLTLVALFVASLAFGQERPVTVRAAEQVVTGSMIRLKGAVEIAYDKMLIRADEIDFNVATGDIEARGNVQAVATNIANIDSAPKADGLWININKRGSRFVVKSK